MKTVFIFPAAFATTFLATLAGGPLVLANSHNETLETALETALETLVVYAAREPISASELGSSVTVLNRDLLEQRQMAPLGEILRSVPGLAVSRTGMVGSQTQLRLRGAEGNHVMVFIDGVKVNDAAQGGEFNMAHLLNYGLESVEIIRGPQSALWGSDALAGIINITTRRAEGGWNGDVLAESGGNGWRNFGAGVRYADERLQFRFKAVDLTTNGENISREGKEEDGYDNRNLNLGLGYVFSESFRVDASLHRTEAENEFDSGAIIAGPNMGLVADSSTAKTEVEQLYGKLAMHFNTPGGHWQHKLSYARTDTENDDSTFTKSAADVTLLAWQSSVELIEGHRITGALERQEEDYRQSGPIYHYGLPNDPFDPNRSEDMTTGSIIFEYRGKLGDAFSLLVSARHDDNSEFNDKSTGRLSAAWRISEGTKLRAAGGTGIKNPAFTERYGTFTNFIGNPGLIPEKSAGWEVGFDQSLGELSLSLTYFREALEDEINTVYVAPLGRSTAENGEGVSDRQGIEFSGNWPVSDDLHLSFAYTRLDATEEDAKGNRFDEIRRAEHIASANLNWRFPEHQANLNLNVDYNGDQDDSCFSGPPCYGGRIALDGFTLVTLSGSYQITSGLQVFARVENALDEDYEEVYGYETLGRTAYMGLRYSLSN